VAGDEAPTARTSRGELVGAKAGGVCVFRGVRYAQPPTGPRRFAPPVPLERWDGPRPALEPGPACPQGMGSAAPPVPARPPVFGGLFGPGAHGTSEDCLHLTVWTPACDRGRRPVLVFIHGGAFRLGTSTAPTYDGARLAARGDVVVVACNYRLGPFGFLHLPELGAVNLGLLDQVAALEWVAAEIESFGGDPAAVTVFGESAGAKSIECLLAMPAASGLFRSAILESTYAPGMDPAVAADFARAVAEAAGAGTDPRALAELPADALLGAVTEVQLRSGPNLWGGAIGPVVDGTVLPEHPVAAAAAGSTHPVPLVVGTTADEARLFGSMAPGWLEVGPAELTQRLAAVVAGVPGAPPAAELAPAYRRARAARGHSSEPADILYAVQTDRLFRQHSIALAERHAGHQPHVWMYLFSWSAAGETALGACHALELPFVFGTLDGPTAALTGTDERAWALSATMADAWIGFARDGVPGALSWPRYEPTRRATLQLGESVAVLDDPEADERALWRDARWW